MSGKASQPFHFLRDSFSAKQQGVLLVGRVLFAYQYSSKEIGQRNRVGDGLEDKG